MKNASKSLKRTIMDDVIIWREDTFGSVACIKRFSDLDEVIKEANNTEFDWVQLHLVKRVLQK